MKKINFDILEELNAELSTKYLYLGLAYLIELEKAHYIEIDNDTLANKLGITKSRMYRARSNLVKMGAIKHISKYCENTGRKKNDVYEIA